MAGAAYAALVSLMHTIEQIQRRRTRLPIYFEKIQYESLHEKVTFLIDFLEGCTYTHDDNKEAEEDLESRIRDTAFQTEDIIETHVVEHIVARFEGDNEKTPVLFCSCTLDEVIEDMDFITKEVMKFKERGRFEDQQQPISTIHDDPTGSSPVGMNNVVGLDNELIQLMEELTGQESSRRTIPIVGMGGIGKTTLAKSVYVNQAIVEHFDIRAWVTISKEYNVRNILLEILSSQIKQGSNENFEKSGNETRECHQLGEQLYKSLCGRRYLVIMDDMWDIEVWDKVKMFFPDNNCGSRIVVTTRESSVAIHFDSCIIKMDFLDDDKSWNLFCEKVFLNEGCPTELEETGKRIVKNCKGLPLSIVVIGGLIAKSKRTRECWEHVANNVNSFINLGDNEHCMNILSLSYHHLPIHLKPCFLYMGVFPEDSKIRVSYLVNLWVAEGFLKPDGEKNLEDIGEEYLKDLIDRNLILVHTRGSTGKIKHCNIHDVLRDICLRQSQKEKFMNAPEVYGLDFESITGQGIFSELYYCMESRPLYASVICDFYEVLPLHDFKYLRILKVANKHKHTVDGYQYKDTLDDFFQIINSRYIEIEAVFCRRSISFCSMSLLWNLQTLIVKDLKGPSIAPSEIWEMAQLRHLEFKGLYLPDPPSGQLNESDDLVLGNLKKLLGITNFKFNEEVIKRIPNIKKLRITYCEINECIEEYCFQNIGCLYKLESLSLEFRETKGTNLEKKLVFPCSIKKLYLEGNEFDSEFMTKIGVLPYLDVIKLNSGYFKGNEWNPVEGQFCQLKYLSMKYCQDLKDWTADSTHFPCLENLVLQYLYNLKEIPSDIGYITTLQSIQLEYCSESSVNSAEKILMEQDELGNIGLQIRAVRLSDDEVWTAT